MGIKIFGKEPALIVGLVGAVLTTLAALGMPYISAGAAAAVTAFVSSVLMAVTTKPAAPALFVGIVTAGAALLAQYGVHASEEVVASLSGTVLALFALLTRAQVSPAAAAPARSPLPR